MDQRLRDLTLEYLGLSDAPPEVKDTLAEENYKKLMYGPDSKLKEPFAAFLRAEIRKLLIPE